jgi:hypothetical protein
MRSGIPSGDVDASFPSRERTQEYLPPSERISDIEDSNNDDDVVYGLFPTTMHTTEIRVGDATETLESPLRRTA